MAKRPLNVLVVDDDRAIQRMVADALTQQGFAVTVERDGEWALKAFEAKVFDAVVLDLLLPAVNGYEVARRIRESPKGKTLPIVMISGVYRNELHQKEAIEHYGASAFLEKPFKLAALYDALRAALKDRYPKGPVPKPELPAVAEASAQEKLAGPEAMQEVKLVEQASRAPGTATATIRGDFQTTPLPEVLAELRRWKAHGALMCRRASVKKIIYLRDGVPQFVKSNLLSECLGRVMVRELLLSEADCAESLKLMKETKRQQGTVLIEMGVISPNNLAHALNLQQRAKMLELFTWTSGQYQLTQDRDLPSETVNLEMTAAAIIWEGVRRVYDAARLALSLGAVDDQFVHPSADPLYALQDSGLGEEEQQALQAMDGTKTVAALRALELLPPLDLYRLIYAMKCAGVVELKPKVAVDEPAISFQEVAEASRSAPRAIPPPAQPAVPFDPPRPKAPRPSAQLAEEPEVTQPAHDEPMQPTQSPSVFVSRALVEVSGAHGVASAEEGLKRERLAAHVAAMRKQDHFEVLGVPTAAAPDAIHKAYLVLAREFHPDKLAGATSAEVRQLTEQIYNRVALAHDTLMDEAERKRYVKDLEAGPPKKEDGENVGKILSAEGRFQRGEELIKKGAWAQAHKEFAEAVQLYGDEGAFHAFLGWSRFQMDPRDPKNAERALQDLKKAIELNPKSDRTYLFAGHIQKAIGRVDLAEQHFEKALQVNPSCNEALQELSILSWAARLGGGKGKR